jgi:predicted dinucleotide-binding enzyme
MPGGAGLEERHGEQAKIGVQGTGSYGAGLARYLAACGAEVVEAAGAEGRT